MGAASRRVRLGAGVAGAAAVAAGALHLVEHVAYHSHLKHVDPALARVGCLQTENGFYYSYYGDLVDAGSIAEGLREIVWDTRSEYPDTLNALRRFNIYQEVCLAGIFRVLRSLGLAIVDAWTFFRYALLVHSSLGQVALSLLSAELSGNPLAGVAFFLLSFLNRFQISRLGNYASADLREHWGMPLLWIQTWCLWHLLTGAAGGQPRRALWSCFAISTLFFIVSWQFSPFLLLLQATALYFTCLVADYRCIRGVLVGVVDAYLYTMAAAFLLHFGSPYLATSPFLAQIIGLRVATWLRSFCWLGAVPRPGPRSAWLGRRLLDVAEGVVAVIVFGGVLKAMSPFATADTHVYEILCTKAAVVNEWLPASLRLPAERLPECTDPSFNARLYLVMGVFNQIEASSLNLYSRTSAMQAAAAACALALLRCALRPLVACWVTDAGNCDGNTAASEDEPPKEQQQSEEAQNAQGLRKRKGGKDSKPEKLPETSREPAQRPRSPPETGTAACEDAALLFFVVQFLLFCLLGFFINRLRVAFGPLMMVLAASAAGPRLLAWYPAPRVRHVLTAAAFLAHAAHVLWVLGLLPCAGDEEGACGQMSEKKANDGDLADMMEWMNQHLPLNLSILASMNLAGTMRTFVRHPMIIHPQFESENLRKRVQRAYEMYHCATEESFAQTMLSLEAKVVIFEYARCFFTPYTLDDRRKNCVKGKHEAEDQLCLKLHVSQGRFKLLFANGGYAVFRLLNTSAGKALQPAVVSKALDDPETWTSYVNRCAAQQGTACGPRLMEAAAVWFHGLHRPAVAQVLRRFALEKFPQDGIVQYYTARYLDYDAKRSREAGVHYEAAAKALPNNPFALREYLMWLDLVAKDQRRLQELLQRRGQKPLLELQGPGVSDLWCEASASAKELGLGDLSRQLWLGARGMAPLGTCVKNNWPLLEPGEGYEDHFHMWARFWAFLAAGVTHEIGPHHGPAVRYSEPRVYVLSPALAAAARNSSMHR